ncbi:exo-rhamnogalacturonase B [Stachybotrys elegans]|uniref:Exo-rhamnogalacturonase B n=1 Tax=Stachybotrys elegans TaxID=80388 RepID=A0A8K0SLE3_9HYPO|nr:exo-rhamnogalacturonase B [Stachybotrys elegans]
MNAVIALLGAAAVAAIGPQLPLSPHTPAHRDSIPAPDVPSLEHWESLAASDGRRLCVIDPNPQGGNDGPAIERALTGDCRTNSLVVLAGDVYHIETPMNTTTLDNVIIHQYGRLLWSPDIDYWLTVTMPVEFQNQSTVWYFGGDNILWDGHGFGTLDGNGQVWYDWAHGRGNLPHRPMNINYRGFNNSIVRNMRYVQSQMWTMAVTYSRNLLFSDIYVNNTSSSEHNTLNTDGVDTVYSDNITFNRWTVTNGDDHIALKGNSSNIFVYDSVFYDGQGVAIGSMGQFDGKWEYIENFYARNITLYNTAHVSYLKTWSGDAKGYPPNGGGGGRGHARNIVMEDIKIYGSRQRPFFSWQCEHYEGDMGKNCNSSEFKMSDVVWRNVSGTAKLSVDHVGHFQCSAAAGGCNNFTVENIEIRREGKEELFENWYCENVFENNGFTCFG